jgi:hypothetical protein
MWPRTRRRCSGGSNADPGISWRSSLAGLPRRANSTDDLRCTRHHRAPPGSTQSRAGSTTCQKGPRDHRNRPAGPSDSSHRRRRTGQSTGRGGAGIDLSSSAFFSFSWRGQIAQRSVRGRPEPTPRQCRSRCGVPRAARRRRRRHGPWHRTVCCPRVPLSSAMLFQRPWH